MISPDEIRAKAQRKYRAVLRAQVRGQVGAFFPMQVRGNRKVSPTPAEAAREVAALRDASRAERGFGYEVEWQERRSRSLGKNPFPGNITIPGIEDFLRLIGKQAEFRRFDRRVNSLRAAFPELEPWLEKNMSHTVTWEPHWDDLCEVLDYFREHPAPGVFARELPLRVDSKFIEHHAGKLRPLLEAILPDSAIDAAETDFDRRFGLRPFEAMIRMRFLDPELQRAAGVDQEEFGLPVDRLRAVGWPIRRVVIVENARCLLTLPRQPGSGTLGLFGHGYRVSNFSRLDWLAGCEIFYWGDIDVQGYEILSDLRGVWSHAKSMLMDRATVDAFGETAAGEGKPSQRRREPALEADEFEVWRWCRDHNRRIEQERIPLAWCGLG